MAGTRYQNLSDQITVLLVESGISQQDIADRADVAQQYISHIKTQKSVPSIITAQRILRALGYKLVIEKMTDDEKSKWKRQQVGA